MNRNSIILFLLVALPMLFTSACQQPGGDSTGSEYMPDMAHSIAMEANTYNYYYHNTWDSMSVVKLKDISLPRHPVNGTVPRGYAGVDAAATTTAKNAVMSNLNGEGAIQAIAVPINGNVPYYYEDSDTGRILATNEIIYNPFPITTDGLARGKDLYNIFCATCHGDKGDGNGYLVREDGGVYPAAPANFLTDEFVAASNGRYYHAVMYGKNVMGGYADKVSYEERWQVIHYIRGLQAKEKKLVYTAEANTLNAIDVPAKLVQPVASNEVMEEAHGHEHEGGDGGHGEEHHNEENHGGGH